jgi:antirestriction protein ArdC
MDQNNERWKQLLTEAVTKPGSISSAYSAFWNYSSGNQFLAWSQCASRNIPIGPLASYKKWKDLGRQVEKGSKAIALCMPVTYKRKETDTEGNEKDVSFSRFIYRKNWFVLSQTKGADYETEQIPDWNRATALKDLSVTESDFDLTDGNVQGYARARTIAINPVARHPQKTTFHELGHVLLGHTEETVVSDSENLPRSLKEAEAESVALICLESLGLPGAHLCRGYIQGWLSGAEIPERSAQKIFKTADRILKSGRELRKFRHKQQPRRRQ